MDKLEPVERVGETSAEFGARIGKKEWPSPVPAAVEGKRCSNCGASNPDYTHPCGQSFCWHCEDNRGRHDDCEICRTASTPLPVDLEEKLRELLQPLKDICDRSWEDETPEQIVVIAANAIYWRDQEIQNLKKLATLGRAEAIEEAAKVCENVIGVPESKIRAYLAESIRALKEKG